MSGFKLFDIRMVFTNGQTTDDKIMIKITHNIIQVEGDNKTAYVSLLRWGITWSYGNNCRYFWYQSIMVRVVVKTLI